MFKPKRSQGIFVMIFCAMLMIGGSAQAAAVPTIYAQLEENLLVDAIVTAPDASPWAAVIRVRPAMPDVKTLQETLIPGVGIVEEQLEEKKVILTFENQASLYESATAIVFSTQRGDLASQVNALQPMLNETTRTAPDLAFASRKKVQADTEAMLNSIGIPNARCIAAYALPQQRLQDFSDRMTSNPEMRADIAAGRIQVKDKWGKEDECYILRFELMFGTIPVFSEPRNLTMGSLGSSNLKVMISSAGFERIDGSNMLQEVATEEPQALLAAEQVPALIRDKYRNLIASNPTTVREIALMYILTKVPGESEVRQLIPAWCCRVVETYNAGQPDQAEWEGWFAFDARSGKILF